MTKRPSACWLTLPALAIVVAGCGSDDGTPPRATAPLELVECVDPGNAADEAACLDQIERLIESDIAGVENAIGRANDVLGNANSGTFEFSRVTPAGNGDDPAEAADSIELLWRVGTTERTMFVCSTGETVEVGADPCPG